MIATLVFSRIALNGISTLRLVPGSNFCQPVRGMQIWDLASVVSLSRNLVETYLTLHYMLEPLSSNDEAALRENVWRYHETFERLKMLRFALPDSTRIPKLETELASRRSAVEHVQVFLNLPKGIRSRILKGEMAKLKTHEELCTGAGVNPDYFKSMFKYGSNHTHSSPFSFAQMDSFTASDPEAVNVFNLALQSSTGFSALAIRDFVKAFPDQSAALSARETGLLQLWEGILRWERH